MPFIVNTTLQYYLLATGEIYGETAEAMLITLAAFKSLKINNAYPTAFKPDQVIIVAPVIQVYGLLTVNTFRLTNVSIVRLKKGGKRFEASHLSKQSRRGELNVAIRLHVTKTRSRNGAVECAYYQ